jgi:hypothetical protein
MAAILMCPGIVVTASEIHSYMNRFRIAAAFGGHSDLIMLAAEAISAIVVVRYHFGGSMKLNACILLLAHMVYL